MFRCLAIKNSRSLLIALLAACLLGEAAHSVEMGGLDLNSLRDQLQNQQGSKNIKQPPLMQPPMGDPNDGNFGRRGEPKFPEISPIEWDYAKRPQGKGLHQFGYEAFSGSPPTSMGTGTISEDYILGVGDEIVVNISGRIPKVLDVSVNSEGRLVLPDLPPILASGRTFGELRTELESRITASKLGEKAYTSVGTVRMISVVMMGEVSRPGMVRLTGLSSLIDALYAAGGINKGGSLRNISLHREGQEPFVFDAYDLLMNLPSKTMPLMRDGDRVVVPTIGATVAVTGDVKRPGIFELKSASEGSQKILLQWAGGFLRPRGNLLMYQSLDRLGRERMVENGAGVPHKLGDNDLLIVRQGGNRPMDMVTLSGHVRNGGTRSLVGANTASRLVGKESAAFDRLGQNPYMPLAVIVNKDPETGVREYRAVNLGRIIHGEEDAALVADSELIILGEKDVRFFESKQLRQTLMGIALPGVNKEKVKERKKASKNEGGFGIQGVKGFKGFGGMAGRNDSSFDSEDNSKDSGPDSEASGNEGAPRRFEDSYEARMRKETKQLRLSPPWTTPQEESYKGTPVREDVDEPSRPKCRSLSELLSLVTDGKGGRLSSFVRRSRNQMQDPLDDQLESQFDDQPVTGDEAKFNSSTSLTCPDVFENNSFLLPFVLEYVVAVHGEVRHPGPYPVVDGVTLDSLVKLSGGLTRDSDPSNIEVARDMDSQSGAKDLQRSLIDLNKTEASTVSILPGDFITVRAKESDRERLGVNLLGEFRRPGYYEISRSETMSAVMERAGGLTEQAYPLGAVFMREQVKDEERRQFARYTRDLQEAVFIAMQHKKEAGGSSGSGGGGGDAVIQIVNSLVRTLKETKPIGRIVVEADPTILAVRPEIDSILMAGDTIYMPKRVNTVTVVGEVLNQGSMSFQPGTRAEDYIRMAGGVRETSDEKRVFVIYPNGTAQPVRMSAWNMSQINIPPGSTIVVPRDATPFDFMGVTSTVTGIFSNLAIAAASISVISK